MICSCDKCKTTLNLILFSAERRLNENQPKLVSCFKSFASVISKQNRRYNKNRDCVHASGEYTH